MSDRREKPETSRMGPSLAFAALILIAYPLSIGPMVWLAENGYIAGDNAFVIAIYVPLDLLVERVPAIKVVLLSYIGLWSSG